MKTIGIIPARYGSTRLKAKVLADINGKPMIQHVYEKAKQCRRLNEVLVACDDKRIVSAVEGFGGQVVLTSIDHPSGSDRIAEAVKFLKVDTVVNIQGDEPLISPKAIDNLVETIGSDRTCVMATLIKKLEDPKKLKDPNTVKVVVDENFNALYFSRSSIPFNRDEAAFAEIVYYRHLGIYAYRKEFLLKFVSLAPSGLEKIEKLEQLRALEGGYKIKTIVTDSETISVDTEKDLKRVRRVMAKG